MTNSPWQCLICGTVYAWWVASCHNPHTPAAQRASSAGPGCTCYWTPTNRTPRTVQCPVHGGA